MKKAKLSRYKDETLTADDDVNPTDQQVKNYVDDRFSDFNPSVRGVDYWTNEDKQEVIDETFNVVMEDIDEELNTAIDEMKETAFTIFDVADGKLNAGYSREDNDYYFQLNGNILQTIQ